MDKRDYRGFHDRLNQQRITGKFCDAQINSRDGKEFLAHKCVLSAASAHFEQEFNSNFKEAIDGKVNLDMDSDIVELLLQYMYTYKIEIDESIAPRLLPEAAYLLLDRLKERCAKFLLANVTPLNCVEMWSLASLHSCEKMKNLAWKMMCRNFDALIDSPEFLGLDKKDLLALLADKSLRCRESSVFSGVCNWVRADLENRKQHMKELLSLVRLSCLEKDYLLNTVGSKPLVTEDKGCFHIFVNYLKKVARAAPDSSRNRGMRWKASGTWTDGPEFNKYMSFTCSDTCSAVVFERQIYCARDEIYVLSNDAWRQITSPIVESDMRWKLCVLADSMYAIGVVSGNRNVYKFEKGSETWTLVHSAVGKHGIIVSATVLNDRICVADWKTETIEIFDLSHAECGFVRLCALPAGLTSNFPLCTVDGRLMTVGGYPYTNQVYVFDPSTDSWSTEVALEKVHARCNIGATVYEDRLVIAGGFQNGSQLQSVQMLVDNEWKSLPSLQHARDSCGVVVLDNVLYMIGGYTWTVEMLRLDEE